MKGTESTYLLLDNRIVKETENLHLELGKIQKSASNPLFGEDLAWESRFDNMYPNVIYDEEEKHYKLWYNSFIRDGASDSTPQGKRSGAPYRAGVRTDGLLYATSQDGLTWEKPLLGIVPFDNNGENNLVMSSETHGIHGVGVFKDPQDSDSARRYKAFFRCSTEKKMSVAFSPDGLHWSSPSPWPEFDAVGDTHNNAFRLPQDRGYVGITRGWEGDKPNRFRTVLRTDSADFIHWSEPEKVFAGNGMGDQIYSMPVVRYGNIYLGLPAIYHEENRDDADWDKVDTELAWSPDTSNWHRICHGTPLIARGEGEYPTGTYDCGCIYAAAPLLIGDTIYLYYLGSNGLHTGFREGFLNLSTLPRDRFAGYAVTDKTNSGRLVTQPFLVGANIDQTLQINADISQGSLSVALLTPEGTEMHGFGLDDCEVSQGKGPFCSVRWQKSLADLTGQRVSFLFSLNNALLFAISGDIS